MRLRWIRWTWMLGAMAALGVLGAIAIVVLLPKRTGIEGWSVRAVPRAPATTTQAAVEAAFAPGAKAYPASAYETLARHVLEGWAGYRTPDGERAHYPGLKSEAGRATDGLEGFARMFPMAAAWLASGRPTKIGTGGSEIDLVATFARGLIAGTDPASPAYWGPVRDQSQSLVEAADVALGLWLSREQLWTTLDAPARARVVAWLQGAVAAEPYEGNWQLFPMLAHRALKGLGVDTSRWDARIESSWQFFKTFHRGDGWFFDPPNGFDYYNAWSIHYAMFWLARMDPSFERAFAARTLGEFNAFYKHFFGPQGHPMMGRSVCYRTAAPLPLLTAQVLAPESASRGEAMRALDLTWSTFVARGALADGTLTQGFCRADPALVPLYTGPASCLWGLRSLVVAFALDRELGLFDAPRAPLPVERGDYAVKNTTLGWTVTGTRETGRIALAIEGNPAGASPPLRAPGAKDRALEWLMHKPRRTDNHESLYGRREYATDASPASCPAPAR